MSDTPGLDHERVDDIPLILGPASRLKLPGVLGQRLGRHHLHRGLSPGWIATVWTAHILSQADHRKSAVRDWPHGHRATLERLIGQPSRDAEFTDARLAIPPRRLAPAAVRPDLEARLWEATREVHQLPVEQVRLDGTTTCGHHAVAEGGPDAAWPEQGPSPGPAPVQAHGRRRRAHRPGRRHRGPPRRHRRPPALCMRPTCRPGGWARGRVCGATGGGWCLERDFHLLEDAPPGSRPLYVRRDERLVGLAFLLPTALRVPSLCEVLMRQGRQRRGDRLGGLSPGQPGRTTDRPSGLAVLRAVTHPEVTLTRVRVGHPERRDLTMLPPLLKRVLEDLGLEESW